MVIRFFSIFLLISLSSTLFSEPKAESSNTQNSGDIRLEFEAFPENTQGLIISFYRDEESFLKNPDQTLYFPLSGISGNQLLLEDIAHGSLAIAIAADTNGNQKLDTRIFGIPSEPVAFADIEDTGFGIPKFKKCATTHSQALSTFKVVFKSI